MPRTPTKTTSSTKKSGKASKKAAPKKVSPKQAAPKKRASSKPAEAPATAQAPKEYTLEDLAKQLGPADAELRETLFDDADEEKLVEDGAGVDSLNVIKDVPLFVGQALEIQASLRPHQRGYLLLSPAILPLIVDETLTLRKMLTRHLATRAKGAANKADREAIARRELQEGITRRNTFYDGLRNALGDAVKPKIDELTGVADTHEALASGMERLADFVDDVLKNGTPQQKKELAAFAIGADTLQAMRDKATSVREAGEAVVAPERRVAQRNLDLHDGRVLDLLGRVLRAFRAAKRQDATILVPELPRIGWKFEIRSKTRKKGEGDAKGAAKPAAKPEKSAPKDEAKPEKGTVG